MPEDRFLATMSICLNMVSKLLISVLLKGVKKVRSALHHRISNH